jgi:hypothetical protein
VEGYFTALDVYPAQLTAVGLAKPAEEFFGGFLKIERCDVAFSLSVLQLSPVLRRPIPSSAVI